MVDESAGFWELISAVFISIMAQFAMPAAPLAQGALPIYLVTEQETLRFSDPVDLQMVESEYGAPNVLATLSTADAENFADFTGRHIGEPVGFVVCDQEIMAPVVQQRIAGGQFVISSSDNNQTLLGFLQNGCP